MYPITLSGPRIFKGSSRFWMLLRGISSRSFNGDGVDYGSPTVEEFLNESWKSLGYDYNVDDDSLGPKGHSQSNFSIKRSFIDEVRSDAARILEILHQDGPGFNVKANLSDLGIRISGLLVRDVLRGILKTINYINRNRCAKLGYKFFVWAGEQDNYIHTVDAYHLIMKICAESEEFKAMWRLLDEMIEKGYPTTARTFNILICTCGEAGLARKVVETFVKSKTFNYRKYKHSFNAILHSLFVVNQYKLIEWVYQKMLVAGHSPDVLTYNIIMSAKCRLGKRDEFHRLLDEMGRNGFSPDSYTFNLLLHVLGKDNKPLSAVNLLNHMKEVGIAPSTLHFTTLMDGLSRAGNMEACQYFFNEMIKDGCTPDVVCYTVVITGYVVSGEIDKAREMFAEMISKGQLPNVFTYNSMIRGLCMVGKFEEACLLLKEMETNGCNPNFLVYSTLVSYLQNAGKVSEAYEIVRHMTEKGHYIHLLSKIRRYRRC